MQFSRVLFGFHGVVLVNPEIARSASQIGNSKGLGTGTAANETVGNHREPSSMRFAQVRTGSADVRNARSMHHARMMGYMCLNTYNIPNASLN